MKKRVAFILILGMLLIPLWFRTIFPQVYNPHWHQYPLGNLALFIGLDIIWMWLTLICFLLVVRLVRWLCG
ncbi:hypothetical protein [Spirosoma sp.]|uniref:hypothetical protein n=1 Tax=Spirosoma sp. TaxID=1899569 RepID=UPI003B3A7525